MGSAARESITGRAVGGSNIPSNDSFQRASSLGFASKPLPHIALKNSIDFIIKELKWF